MLYTLRNPAHFTYSVLQKSFDREIFPATYVVSFYWDVFVIMQNCKIVCTISVMYIYCVCSEVQEDDDETVGMIKELLDTRIRYVEDSFFLFPFGGGREGGTSSLLCIFYHTSKNLVC